MPLVRGVRGLGVCIATGVLLLAATGSACKKTASAGFLQDADLKLPDGMEAPFDRNTIVDTASFVDIDGIDGPTIQKFLHKNAYDRSSFLETYQSNGVSAANAIGVAARTYRINPLVLLVEAEAVQGLVGAVEYPFPPERVEYVFRCGCLTADNCLPELASARRSPTRRSRSARTSRRTAASACRCAIWARRAAATATNARR